MRSRALLIQALLFCVSVAYAQEPAETQNISLDSVTVAAKRSRLPLGKDAAGRFAWDMKALGSLPQILSTADPLHYAQMLPGIQTNNEYQAGIHVQGSDNGHNAISIDGVPLYNVSHLLGFFSAFVTSHFSNMTLSESAQTADFPNRLGAELTMGTDDRVPRRAEGELSVGLMSSEGSLRIPTGKSSALAVSARLSYINMLYGAWLKTDGQQMRYSFHDVNASYTFRLGKRHSFLINSYFGNDDAKLAGDNYLGDTRNTWGNTMVSLRHRFEGGAGLRIQTTLYTTHYRNRMTTNLLSTPQSLSAKIADYGLRSDLTRGDLRGGAELVRHELTPQTYGSANASQSARRVFSHEASLYGDYRLRLTDALFANVGARACLYRKQGDGTLWSLNPSAKLSYYTSWSKFTLSYAIRHQYLFQSELSGEGIPVMAWVSADRSRRAQYSRGVMAASESNLLGRRYKVSVAVYYKRLFNQMETNGTLLDAMSAGSDLTASMLWDHGKNYGANIMVSKCTGIVKGWICYSYGRSRRTFTVDGTTDDYPANHDRTHEVNMLATCSPNAHWSFGACFVACTGTPFTAPTCMYMLNGNIISQMGRHNANRLGDYCRLDLSANYKWKDRKGREHGINLSLYNALCRTNDLYHYVRVSDQKQVYYKSVKFVSPVLPSVSYFIKF